MPSHRAPKLSTRKTSAFAIAGLATGSVLMMQGSAHAETIQQAKTDYNQKMEQSDAADEAYDAAQSQAAQLQSKVNALQSQISTDTSEMASLQRTMGLQAAQQYESAGMSQTLQLAFQASPEKYLSDALTNNEIAAKEAQLLKTLAADKAQIAADQKLAATELAQQQAAVATAQKQKNNALSEAASAKTLLDSLTAQQQEQIQQSENGPTSPTQVNTGNVPAPNARAAGAVAYAESKLGDTYIYASAGPNTFDCSGLTMAAWASVGVNLAHNAAEQYEESTPISASQLEPGDLVFFVFPGDGGEIGHVGIYVGNNMMINATHTGSYVQYDNIYEMDALAMYYGRV